MTGRLVKGLALAAVLAGLAACSNSTPAPTVALVQVSGTMTVTVGATTPLTAVALDASGKTVSGVKFTWASDATGIATVDANTGVVTGVTAGSAKITATGGGKSGTATVTVNAAGPVIATVQVTSPAGPVPVGGLSQLVATALDASNTPIPNTTFTWNSDNAAVAAVDTNGVVTGVASGSANITASAGGKTSAGVAVTVVAATPPAAGTISGTVTLPAGGTYNGNGSVTACFITPAAPKCDDANGNTKNVPLNADGSYTITGLAAGSYIVKAGQNNAASGGLFQPGNYYGEYPVKDGATAVTAPAGNINFQFQVLTAAAAAKLKSQYPFFQSK